MGYVHTVGLILVLNGWIRIQQQKLCIGCQKREDGEEINKNL